MAGASELRDFERAAADWSWEVDRDLGIVDISPGITTVVGRPCQLLKGESLTSLGALLPDAGGEPPLLRARSEGAAVRGQLLRIGPAHLYRLEGAPLFDRLGRLTGFRGIATRVDGDQTNGTMADELRAPLEAIIRHSHLMAAAQDGAHQAAYADYARDIDTASHHLMALLTDISPAGTRAPAEGVDAASVIQEAMAMVSLRARGKQLTVGPLPSCRLNIRADRHRVLQILVNLLTNAVKFTPAGGRIGVDVGEEGERICIRVWDTGPGIAPGDRDRIFGKFAKLSAAQEEGSGLGLHISRGLAREMGGDLTLESAPDKGARFLLTLPAA